MDPLEKELSNINCEIQQCIMMFNSVLKDMSEILLTQFPDELLLKTYYEVLKEIFTMKPQEPISKFVFNIYKNKEYRKNIMTGNDEFFQDVKNLKDNDKIKLFFQFRTYWKKLSKSKQVYIKNALKTMIEISELYIIGRDKGNTILEKITCSSKTDKRR